MSTGPLQYAVYKGTGGRYGAIQFNFQKPHFYNGKMKSYDGFIYDPDKKERTSVFEADDNGRKKLKEGWKEREGAIFTEIAPSVDKNKYDWNQKIIMALSINDLGKLLYFLATGKSPNKKERERDGKSTYSMTIMHDPNAKTPRAGEIQKYLTVFSPGGTAEGCMISITHKEGDSKRRHEVPVTGDEVIVLRSLIQSAISNALNW